MAYLAGLLAAKLRQVEVQLKDTSGALENLQALHENIVQSISGGLITTGLDGHITLVNAAAQELLKRSEANSGYSRSRSLFLDPLPSVDSERAHAEVRCAAADGFRKTFRVIVSALLVPGEGSDCTFTPSTI